MGDRQFLWLSEIDFSLPVPSLLFQKIGFFFFWFILNISIVFFVVVVVVHTKYKHLRIILRNTHPGYVCMSLPGTYSYY